MSLLDETHSGATRREESLLTAPVRIAVVISVVGDWLPASSDGFDGVDLFVAFGDGVSVGYPLATGTVVRRVVVRGVVGDWSLASSSGIDGVDLGVRGLIEKDGAGGVMSERRHA